MYFYERKMKNKRTEEKQMRRKIIFSKSRNSCKNAKKTRYLVSHSLRAKPEASGWKALSKSINLRPSYARTALNERFKKLHFRTCFKESDGAWQLVNNSS